MALGIRTNAFDLTSLLRYLLFILHFLLAGARRVLHIFAIVGLANRSSEHVKFTQ